MTNQPDPMKAVLHALLSPDDLAQRWGCSKGYLANERCRGAGVPYIKIGRKVAYRLSAVIAFEDAATVETVPA